MQTNLIYAGRQEHNNYIVRETLEGICGQRVSTGRHAFTSPVQLMDNLVRKLNNDGYYTGGYASYSNP
jgi:hypothetical protein